MADDNLIRANIKIWESVQVKVEWVEGESGWPAYYVNRDRIQRISSDVRNTLKELVYDAKDSKGRRSAEHLKDVAKAGRRLYDALFSAEDGRDNADDAQSWLREKDSSNRIVFSVEDLIHVPWGLVYEGDPEILPSIGTGSDPSPYLNFWCLKYRVTTMYRRIPPRRSRTPIQEDSFRMICVLNQQLFERVRPLLHASDASILHELTGFRNPIYQSKDLFTLWHELTDRDSGVLYFYCHADGPSLSLGTNDMITAGTLMEEFDSKNDTPSKRTFIAFLNGCSTAVGARDSAGLPLETTGFLEATSRRSGLCGFVGTETVVPDIFAKRFGLTFLDHLFRGGVSLYEVMDHLRRKHWPLSLLYGVYCYPLFKIVAQRNSEPSHHCCSDNFCESELGSHYVNYDRMAP